VNFRVATGPACDASHAGQIILPGSVWAPGVPNVDVYDNWALDTSNPNDIHYDCANNTGTRQCTDLAIRWAQNAWGIPPADWGSGVAAEDMFSIAKNIPGLTTIANGAGPPHPGDLIVFSDSGVGHVAVIAGVAPSGSSSSTIYFVGQNQGTSPGAEDTISMTNNTVSSTDASAWLRVANGTGSVLGWIR
jgi:hypothetical protein